MKKIASKPSKSYLILHIAKMANWPVVTFSQIFEITTFLLHFTGGNSELQFTYFFFRARGLLVPRVQQKWAQSTISKEEKLTRKQTRLCIIAFAKELHRFSLALKTWCALFITGSVPLPVKKSAKRSYMIVNISLKMQCSNYILVRIPRTVHPSEF